MAIDLIFFWITKRKMSWEYYVRKRWQGHQNLLKILAKQEWVIDDPTFYPNSLAEYRKNWQEEIRSDHGQLRGMFLRDSKPIHGVGENKSLLITFISPNKKSKNVTGTKIEQGVVSHILKDVSSTAGVTELTVNPDEYKEGINVILITDAPLAGDARKRIARLNLDLGGTIRHFTLNELQFNPLEFARSPTYTKLTQEEIVEKARREFDVPIERTTIVPNFKETYDSKKTPEEKRKYLMESVATVVSKYSIIYPDDPGVKWNGYKIGDVLRIDRVFGNTPIDFRVVTINPGALE